MSLGDLIRRYRLAAGLSQEDLAERAGLSVRGISDLERGRRLSPHMETVRMLSEGLGLSEEARVALIAAARPELRQQVQPTGEKAQGTAQLATSPRRPLPTPPTQLIGRDELVEQIVEHLVQEEVRLITLAGPGGVGKTRVGLEVGHRLDAQFTGGVIFIDIGLLSHAHQLGPALLDALAFTGNQGTDPVGQVIDLLRESSTLLLLDNFEHLLDAATSLSRILAFCPGVSIVVTSRIRLRLRGELVVSVPPLELPAESKPVEVSSPSDITASPAIHLFLERAREASFGFGLTPQNIAPVVEICRRLDGLPLAIELAASWMRVMSPDDLLERLQNRLPSLSGGARDAPERHQTLRSTIAWSLDSLGDDEQRLFRQLSAFSGGATIDALQATAIGQPWSEIGLLDALSVLVDNSLIRQADDLAGRSRFSMLETIRAYGREQIEEHGEGEVLRSNHLRWVRDLAERAEEELVGPNEPHWRNVLMTEQANIRSALEWAITSGDLENGLRLSAALWRFWSKRGALIEGRQWLSRVLDLPGDPQPDLQAKASQALANMSFDLGDYEEAKKRFEVSLAIRRTLDDPSLVANALNGLGLVAFAQGDLERAQAYHQESLELSRKAGSLLGIGNSLSNWADVEMALGNLDVSRKLQEEGLEIRRQLGDENSIAYSLYNLGVLARQEERYDDAFGLLAEAVDLFQSAGDLFGHAYGLTDLGVVRALRGDLARGVEDLQQAMYLRIEIGDQRGMIDCVEGAARLAAVAGLSEEAARLVGAASSRRRLISAPRTPAEITDLSRWTPALEESLSPARYATLIEEGEALSLPQAIDMARAVLETLATNP